MADDRRMDSKSEPETVRPESDLVQSIGGWDSEKDPRNPRNFSKTRKWAILISITCMIAISFLASSIPAPAASLIDADLHNDSTILSSLITTIFLPGFMVGPLIMSPLSEVYGRRPVINSANVFFTLSQIGAALAPNVGSLLAFRLLSGLGSSACMSIGGGIVADLFDTYERGMASSMLTVGSIFGPVVGPLIGGLITQHSGWRWIFWVLLASCAAATVTIFGVAQETNPTVLLRVQVRSFQKSPRAQNLHSTEDIRSNHTKSLLTKGILRPWRILFRSPILFLLCIFVGFVSGLLYLLLTTTSSFFQDVYGWSLDTAGLAYLGLGVGSIAGLIVFAKTSDKMTMRLARANDDVYQPEMRLATGLVPSLLIPVSFFWYGWSTFYQTHWIIPIIGLAPFGFSMICVYGTVQAYLIDASGLYAASSIACVTSVRCIFATCVPLAGPSLYGSLGLGWGNSLLGFLCIGMVPIPVLTYKFGGRLRKRYPFDVA